MNIDTPPVAAPGRPLAALLRGGPVEIPADLRECLVDPDEGTVKLPYCGGYEHFQRTEEHSGEDGRARLVFRWVGRTRIAE